MNEWLNLRITIHSCTRQADLATCVQELSEATADILAATLSPEGGGVAGTVDVLVDDPHLFLRQLWGLRWYDDATVRHMGSVPKTPHMPPDGYPRPQPQMKCGELADYDRALSAYRGVTTPIPRRWYA